MFALEILWPWTKPEMKADRKKWKNILPDLAVYVDQYYMLWFWTNKKKRLKIYGKKTFYSILKPQGRHTFTQLLLHLYRIHKKKIKRILFFIFCLHCPKAFSHTQYLKFFIRSLFSGVLNFPRITVAFGYTKYSAKIFIWYPKIFLKYNLINSAKLFK